MSGDSLNTTEQAIAFLLVYDLWKDSKAYIPLFSPDGIKEKTGCEVYSSVP